MHKNVSKQITVLKDVILDERTQKAGKSSIETVFAKVIEPVIQCKENSIILVNTAGQPFENILRRINFVNPNIYSFNEDVSFLKKAKLESDIGKTEFLIVLSPRYSAALVWDYELGNKLGYEKDTAPFYCALNSVVVSDIAKTLLDNSDINDKSSILKYNPERRRNTSLNDAVWGIINSLDRLTDEYKISLAEKDVIETDLDLLKKYENSCQRVSCISHEVKNHLSIIDLYSKIIEKKLVACSKKDNQSDFVPCFESIESIRKSVFSIAFLLNSLKSNDLKLEKIGIKSVLNNVISMVKPKTESKNIKLVVDACEDIHILVDEIKFQNVILNLLYNSVDAIYENGQINIKVERKEGFLELFVQDNGEGISSTVAESIFESGCTTKKTGQGLGLSICKETMTELGGDIRLEKTEKGLTIFKLKVPATSED